MFRSEGVTHDPVDPDALPALGGGRRVGRVVVTDSERDGLRPRLDAAVADATVQFLLALLAVLFLLVATAELVGTPLPFPESPLLAAVAFVGAPLAAKSLQEWYKATTAGKEPQGLVVADATDGTAPSLRAALVRNLLWPVDALGIGLLAMVATDRNRRLGDLLAGTIVGRDVAAAGEEVSAPATAPDDASESDGSAAETPG